MAARVTAALLFAAACVSAQAALPGELALVYIAGDPDSRAIARHYAAKRGLPGRNLIAVELPERGATIDRETFARVHAAVSAQAPQDTQFLALAWTTPFRVECMSITSAFAFGFDEAWCATRCEPTAESPYYDSPTRYPFRDHGLRPAMMLAGRTLGNVRLMIDRGARADATRPASAAYLVVTSDRARSTRAPRFVEAHRYFGLRYRVNVLEAEGVRDAYDIMFYFTGATHVPWLDGLGFLPGAMADHLTSTGGVLTGGAQMSVLDWLEAGATGSYGTVVEPCNFPQKFPDPVVAMRHYLDGETLIEAYWKSVRWPGQGVFVGEPLARPFTTPEKR